MESNNDGNFVQLEKTLKFENLAVKYFKIYVNTNVNVNHS